MTILVFGATGQVGRELQRRMRDAVCLTRAQADLRDPDACADRIGREVSAVINAAAYTAVDQAEADKANAFAINAAAPAAMAAAAAKKDIPFLHISTDYVFDGHGERPWRPSDRTAPLGVYGRSKLAGEDGVRAAGGRHAILRSSWIVSAHGRNFVKTMLSLSETRDRIPVVADQVGGPTQAAAIAAALVEMAVRLREGNGRSGTYHLAGTPDVSWADFAREIFRQAGREIAVRDIASASYPAAAARPANSRLDCSDLTRDYGISRPDWKAGLGDILTELEIPS